MIGNGVAKLIERALPDGERDQQRIDALVARFRLHYERTCLETTTLYDGIPECLARLADCSLAVLSNKPTRFLERIIAGLGLSGRFARGGGRRCGIEAKARSGCGSSRSLRIAGGRPDARVDGRRQRDRHRDRTRLPVRRTIGCAWGLRGVAELRAAGADFLVDHPREIPPIIAKESAADQRDRWSRRLSGRALGCDREPTLGTSAERREHGARSGHSRRYDHRRHRRAARQPATSPSTASG